MFRTATMTWAAARGIGRPARRLPVHPGVVRADHSHVHGVRVTVPRALRRPVVQGKITDVGFIGDPGAAIRLAVACDRFVSAPGDHPATIEQSRQARGWAISLLAYGALDRGTGSTSAASFRGQLLRSTGVVNLGWPLDEVRVRAADSCPLGSVPKSTRAETLAAAPDQQACRMDDELVDAANRAVSRSDARRTRLASGTTHRRRATRASRSAQPSCVFEEPRRITIESGGWCSTWNTGGRVLPTGLTHM